MTKSHSKSTTLAKAILAIEIFLVISPPMKKIVTRSRDTSLVITREMHLNIGHISENAVSITIMDSIANSFYFINTTWYTDKAIFDREKKKLKLTRDDSLMPCVEIVGDKVYVYGVFEKAAIPALGRNEHLKVTCIIPQSKI